ncbi:allatostatin-A receptor-like [Oculina patagonica]
MEGSPVLPNLSTNNQSALLNTTETRSPIYVFTPAGFTTKLVMVTLLATVGIVGFLGNIFIYYFISSRKQNVSYMKYNPFVRNVNVYVKSLAFSDIFSNIISLPLICTQIVFDVFQHAWACRIVRYLNVLFPSITMNNLIVISIERFLATRAIPRSFSVSTVRKLVFSAWITGFIIALLPASAINGIRYNLNETHFTVVCKIDNSYFMFRVIFASYTVLQYIIPSVVLSYLNICVAKTMWAKQKRRVDIQRDNAIRASVRAAKLRGTYLLVAVTLAFIIPYSAMLYYGIYVMVAKPSIDFQADFITRYLSAVLVFSNSVINFIIYTVQMKDFRTFLKKKFCVKDNVINPNPPGEGIQLQAL